MTVPEQRKDLLRFIINLPHHELCELFDVLHTAVDALEYDSCDERDLVSQFMTTLWVASMREDD